MKFKVHHSLDLSNLVAVANTAESHQRIKILLPCIRKSETFGIESFVNKSAFNSAFSLMGLHLTCSNASEATQMVSDGVSELKRWAEEVNEKDGDFRAPVIRQFVDSSSLHIQIDGLLEPSSRQEFATSINTWASTNQSDLTFNVTFDVSDALMANAACMLIPIRHVTNEESKDNYNQSRTSRCVIEFAPDPEMPGKPHRVLYLDSTREREDTQTPSGFHGNSEILQTGATTRRQVSQKTLSGHSKLSDFATARRKCITVAYLLYSNLDGAAGEFDCNGADKFDLLETDIRNKMCDSPAENQNSPLFRAVQELADMKEPGVRLTKGWIDQIYDVINCQDGDIYKLSTVYEDSFGPAVHCLKRAHCALQMEWESLNSAQSQLKKQLVNTTFQVASQPPPGKWELRKKMPMPPPQPDVVLSIIYSGLHSKVQPLLQVWFLIPMC